MTSSSYIAMPATVADSAAACRQPEMPAQQDHVACSPVFPGAFRPLSREDAARVLGISVRTLLNWTKQGRLPEPVAVAGRRYWHPEVFYAALEAMLRPGGIEGVEGKEVPAPTQADPAKAAKVEVSAAGRQVRQSSSERTAAMLQRAKTASAAAEAPSAA